MDDNDLKTYRHNIIKTFLNQILELDEDEAQTNTQSIENAMSENALTKFVHFLDYITQCTNKNSCSSHCQNRNTNCSNSGNCSSCCGNCDKN